METLETIGALVRRSYTCGNYNAVIYLMPKGVECIYESQMLSSILMAACISTAANTIGGDGLNPKSVNMLLTNINFFASVRSDSVFSIGRGKSHDL